MGITIIGLLIWLIGFGAICAPLLAIVCAVIAVKRKANVGHFALWGALYGASITGSVYILARLYNRSPPSAAMPIIYGLPYLIWILVVVGLIGSMAWIWDYAVGFDIYPGFPYVARRANSGSAVMMSALMGGIAAVSLLAWVKSIRSLCRTYRQDKARPLEALPIDIAYIKPFAYMYLWLFSGLIMALAVAEYAISIGVDIQGF